MRSLQKTFVPGALVLLGACSASATEPALLSATNPLLQEIRPDLSAEEYIARVLRPFDQFAQGGTTISAQQIEDQQSIKGANLRASAVGNVLRHDLNGDFRITSGELLNGLITSSRPNMTRRDQSTTDRAAAVARTARARADRMLQQYDVNKDGVIEMAEIAQGAEPENSGNRRADVLKTLMESEIGKDGKITRIEVKSLGERTFKAVDTDKDGRITRDEYAHIPKPD